MEKRYEFADREVSLLIAKLADFFSSQLPLSGPAKQRDERLQLPTIMLSGPIDDIPEGLAGLGERQRFTLIENTRFGAYKRDPTHVERRLRRSEGQARASPPARRRGRSPTAATIEPKAKAGRGRSASSFVGHGRGRSSSTRQPTLIETDQPGATLARPPPPPPARNVTEYISADSESRHLRQLRTPGAYSQEGSQPQQHQREVMTRTFPDLLTTSLLAAASRFVTSYLRFLMMTS